MIPADLDVAIVTGSLSPAAGGLFESVRVPAVRMADLGATVSAYGIDDPQLDETARSLWAPTSLNSFAAIGPARLGFAPAMKRAILAAGHELLHLHGIWTYSSYAAMRWRELTGHPMVISAHGMMDSWALGHNRGRKLLVSWLYENRNLHNATAMVALCRPEAEAMRAFGLRIPIAVIPNGIDLPDPVSKGDKGGRADSRRTVLFLGRIHPKKGIRELLLAWARLRSMSRRIADDWRLEIAGWDDGNHLASLVKLGQELGLGDSVVFPGGLFGEEKTAAYRRADAFILPSYSEGMPMTVLEAWSHAKPALMTAACNIPEGFEEGGAIEIDTDPDRMARVMLDSLTDDALLRSTGLAGRRLVERRYTWDHVVDQRLLLYRWLIKGGERPEFIADD